MNIEHRIEEMPEYIATEDIKAGIGIMYLFVGIVYICSL